MKKILSDYDKQEYLRIAKHEVGHYVANRTFNVIPDKIIFTYKPENGGNYIGGCQVTFCTAFESFDEIAEYCFQKSIVLVCGALAGALDDKTKKVDLDSAKTRFKEYEVSDKAKLEENIKIHLGTNAKFFEENDITDAYNYTIEKIWSEGKRIVEENADIIIGFGNRLKQEIFDHFGEVIDFPHTEIKKMKPITDKFGDADPDIPEIPS